MEIDTTVPPTPALARRESDLCAWLESRARVAIGFSGGVDSAYLAVRARLTLGPARREKFVSSALARRLIIREGASDEVWPDPPAGIDVRNPYFEVVPLDLVSNVISDVGVLGGDMMRDLCDSLDDESVALRGLRG